MKGANGVIINVTGGYDMTLFEADEACNRIRDEVDPDANIIFGATFDEALEGKMRVSIVATGIEKEAAVKKTTGGTGGGSVMERAKPNTENAASSDTPPAFVSAKTVQAIKAPTPAEQIRAGQEKAAPTLPETEVGMFEQREFADVKEGEQDATVPQNTALRGTLYNDSFIPPKPVEAPSGAPSHISSFHGSHVPEAPMPSPAQTQTAPGLTLNPPKAPTPPQHRSPSLFERITGSVQEHLEGITDTIGGRGETEQPRAKVAPSAGGAMTQSKPLTGPAQGTLDISAPSKPSSGGDEQLDIPAFLRRQAN